MKLLRYIGSHLTWKMVCCFLMFLLAPCLLSALIYYQVSQTAWEEERSRLEETALSQYCAEIDRDIKTCEGVFNQIQQHSNFLRFLNGGYHGVPEQLEAYTQEFSWMFHYAENYSPYVEHVRVYMLREDLLEMGGYLERVDALGEYSLDQETVHGFWRYSVEENRFVFRKAVRNLGWDNFPGIFEITCYPEMISAKMESLSSSIGRKVYVALGGTTYLPENGGFSLATDFEEDVPSGSCQLERIDASVVLGPRFGNGDTPAGFNAVTLTAFFSLFAIAASSLGFFLNVSRLSRRIVNFSKHISNSLVELPSSYQDSGHDEFNLLVNNYNAMLKNNSNLINQIKLEQLRKNEMAYRVLQAQIDPHFIYNALESIRMQAELHNEEEISDMIFALGKLLRYTFSATTGTVPLSSEIDLIHQYMKIQKLRLGERLHFQMSCDERLYSYECPQFVIQPIVENAIKYGLVENRQKLHVSIAVRQNEADSRLIVTVENDGISIPAEKLENINSRLQSGEGLTDLSSGTGIGLDNINNRMRYLFPDSFQMMLETPLEDGGVRVTMSWVPT